VFPYIQDDAVNFLKGNRVLHS